MTIISRDRNFAFIHLHKCGGSSVEKAYGEAALWSDLVVGSTEEGERNQAYFEKRFGLGKHASVSEVVSAIGEEAYSGMTGFALVRDPFSVYESFYAWLSGIFAFHADRHELDPDVVKMWIAEGNEAAEKFHFSTWGSAKGFAASNDFDGFVSECLEHRYLPQQSMVERLAIDTPLAPEYIFPLTAIDQFWSVFQAHIGVSLTPMHSNSSGFRRKSIQFNWSEGNISRVADLFAADIAHFGFDTRPR